MPVVMWAVTLAWWWMAFVGTVTIILSLYARHFDVLNGTAILNYSLDLDAAAKFTTLQVRSSNWRSANVSGISTLQHIPPTGSVMPE